MYTKLQRPSVISLATNPWTSLASKIGNSLSLRSPAWLPEMQGCQSFTLAEAIVSQHNIKHLAYGQKLIILRNHMENS